MLGSNAVRLLILPNCHVFLSELQSMESRVDNTAIGVVLKDGIRHVSGAVKVMALLLCNE